MRFIGLAIILLSLPLLIAWLKSRPRQRKWAYCAIGILPFTMGWLNLDASIINWGGWPGYAKGMVVTVLDTLALAIILTSKVSIKKLPMVSLFIAYILAASISMLFSDLPVSSSFYAFQLVRAFVLFVAVASIMSEPKALNWLVYGLAAGAILQGVVTIEQRLSGAAQAAGTMGHQNLLGLMLHFVTFPLLALLLAGHKNKIITLGVLGALTAIALGASRGTIGFAAIGLALLFGMSIMKGMTSHKWKIVGLAVLASFVIIPVAVNSLDRRYGGGAIEIAPDGERQAFERAAKAMWKDHPMGVGANQYVVTANTDGYSQRAGVVWNSGSRSTNVHNLYLLAAAETGWLGLITLVSLFIGIIIRGLIFAFSNRRDPRSDIVLGAVIAVLTMALHGFYEWVFVLYQTQYLFAISLGIIAGTIYQHQREKALRSKKLNRSRAEVLPVDGNSTVGGPQTTKA